MTIMIINNITNLLTYYMPTVHAYPRYDKISSGTIDDISSLIDKNNKYIIVVLLLSLICFFMLTFLLIFINKSIKKES